MNQESIQHTIEHLLKIMGIKFETITFLESDNRGSFMIKSPESHLLIGTRGAHLAAFNHIVKRIAAKNVELETDSLNFYVDVNDYHQKLMQEIKNKANILAGRARSFKINIEMEPMSSYERMIVHSFFEGSPDIKTESVGTDSNRHVVLKYIEPSRGETF